MFREEGDDNRGSVGPFWRKPHWKWNTAAPDSPATSRIIQPQHEYEPQPHTHKRILPQKVCRCLFGGFPLRARALLVGRLS